MDVDFLPSDFGTGTRGLVTSFRRRKVASEKDTTRKEKKKRSREREKEEKETLEEESKESGGRGVGKKGLEDYSSLDKVT